jgi:hypothetical protein
MPEIARRRSARTSSWIDAGLPAEARTAFGNVGRVDVVATLAAAAVPRLAAVDTDELAGAALAVSDIGVAASAPAARELGRSAARLVADGGGGEDPAPAVAVVVDRR